MIGVEVKSITDLISSIETGRLQASQILGPRGIVANYDVRWLLYYGDYRPSPDDGVTLQVLRFSKRHNRDLWMNHSLGSRTVPYGYVAAFLASPSLTELGVNTQRVADMREASAWIGVLHRLWSKPYDKHTSMRVFDSTRDKRAGGTNGGNGSGAASPLTLSALPHSLDPITEQIARTAATLPGIRFERGVAAARHFQSIRAMVTADAKQWEEVPGIGKVLSRSIVDTVRRERA